MKGDHIDQIAQYSDDLSIFMRNLATLVLLRTPSNIGLEGTHSMKQYQWKLRIFDLMKVFFTDENLFSNC